MVHIVNLIRLKMAYILVEFSIWISLSEVFALFNWSSAGYISEICFSNSGFHCIIWNDVGYLVLLDMLIQTVWFIVYILASLMRNFSRKVRRVHRFILCQDYMMFPMVLYHTFSFDVVYCFIFNRRRVAVAWYWMVCLVLVWWTPSKILWFQLWNRFGARMITS